MSMENRSLGSIINRREFVKSGAAAGLGLAAGQRALAHQPTMETVRVGFVGVGFALAACGALVGRYLFFVSVVPKNMAMPFLERRAAA